MRHAFAKSTVALGVVLGMLLPAQPASAVSREFFGIDPSSVPSEAEFETMGAGRVGTYRFQLFWPTIQPSPGGAYDWTVPDHQVENAALNGIELLPVPYGSPPFAASEFRIPPLGSPEARQAWQQFLQATVERYGPGGEFWAQFQLEHPGAAPRPIKEIQIWNEVNSPKYYQPKPSVKEYAELLEISSEAISSSDPNAKILIGGMFGTPSTEGAIYSWKYLRRLYDVKGIKKHFDAVALHPYSPNLSGIEAQIELAREQMKKAGDRRTPVWVTEIGWGSAGTKGNQLIKTPQEQAKLLKKSFKMLLKQKRKYKLKRVLWFTWKDPDDPDADDFSGAPCLWCSSAGLFDKDLTPKPAWDEYRKFTGAA